MTKINDDYSKNFSLTQNQAINQANTNKQQKTVENCIAPTEEATSNNVYENMGVSINSSKAMSAKSEPKSTEADLEKAIEYYNTKMDYNQRNEITQQTYANMEQILYNMEHSIDEAYKDCDAYSDIMIMPRWHYRYYPYFEDKLLNFDIGEIREHTTKDMESLHQLKDKVEYIIEEAENQKEHTEPEKTPYDVDALAQKYFGMSYSEFAKKYKDELEFCKTVTYADLNNMNETQRFVYAKAKAYAKDMLTTTINEAHTVNWDVGRRKVDAAMNATNDMYALSELEDTGITDESLANIHSNISKKALEKALLDNYSEIGPTEISEVNNSQKPTQRPVKRTVNGVILIFNPDGSVYDLNGKRIK